MEKITDDLRSVYDRAYEAVIGRLPLRAKYFYDQGRHRKQLRSSTQSLEELFIELVDDFEENEKLLPEALEVQVISYSKVPEGC